MNTIAWILAAVLAQPPALPPEVFDKTPLQGEASVARAIEDARPYILHFFFEGRPMGVWNINGAQCHQMLKNIRPENNPSCSPGEAPRLGQACASWYPVGVKSAPNQEGMLNAEWDSRELCEKNLQGIFRDQPGAECKQRPPCLTG